MRLPSSLHEALTNKLGTTISEVRACSGGDINEAAQIVTVSNERLFVKWHQQSPPNMFTAEAKGLKLLRNAQTTLRIPEVIAAQEATDDCPAYLVLEWLERGSPQAHTDEVLGHGLAALHQSHADQHGLDHHNFIGPLHQPNTPHSTWPTFFAEERVRPQIEVARRVGQLSGHRERLLNTLLDKIPQIVPDAPPSLLHGDLWRGNVMILSRGEPAVIDPAVYYGNREMDIAFTQMFGGFSARFYDAYNSSYPLDKDYPQRRALYQLYHTMVHMNLFGGGYAHSVDSILRQYV